MKKKGLFGLLALLLLMLALSGAVSATPLSENGRLRVSGTKIVNASGNTFQIRGVSTHGLSWFPEYANKAAFQELRDNWGVNTIRLAMYTAEYNGYCTGSAQNQTVLKNKIKQCVKDAKSLGMYVIIDWHILSDSNPNTYRTQANAFFKSAAKAFRNYDNVIYEICNEPNGGTSWAQIKSYAEQIIPTIRKFDKNAIIVVGTPTWSQDVDVAAKDRLSGSNIVYALHFYADTHRDSYRAKADAAIKAGLPLLVSEFSICDASGSGAVNESEANKWMSFLNSNGIGCVAWSLCNKAETASLISSGCTKTSGWTASDLSQTGKWLVKTYGGKLADSIGSTTPSAPSTPSTPSVPSVPTQPSAQKASADNCRVKIQRTGGWQSGDLYYTQYQVAIKNKLKVPVENWKIQIDFKYALKGQSAWSGKFAKKGRSIQIKALSWNSRLDGKKTITDIGFIVCSHVKDPVVKAITVK